MNQENIIHESIDLLARMIAIPSISREEDAVCTMLESWFQKRGYDIQRHLNNLYLFAENHKEGQPFVLLNSHIDTVNASDQWDKDPHLPVVEDGKLFGLGANDAGASVVALIGAFRMLNEKKDLPYNLILAITAEEEISGQNGIEAILSLLPEFDLCIVGEPTEMMVATAERGLMVLDVEVKGKTGHAARNEGENAIYKALHDINWFRTFQFPKLSPTLGIVGLNVTQIQAGSQHNVVPDNCTYVVDVRLTDQYSHEEVLDIIHQHIFGKATPRSTRLKPSGISINHWIFNKINSLGINTYGSATMSDQALLPYPSIKMGPGKSERSHTPNEFIRLSEIEKGIKGYVNLFE